jgi:hypothetical protein
MQKNINIKHFFNSRVIKNNEYQNGEFYIKPRYTNIDNGNSHYEGRDYFVGYQYLFEDQFLRRIDHFCLNEVELHLFKKQFEKFLPKYKFININTTLYILPVFLF